MFYIWPCSLKRPQAFCWVQRCQNAVLLFRAGPSVHSGSQAGRLWGGEQRFTPVCSSFTLVLCCEAFWPVPLWVCGGPELPVARAGLWLVRQAGGSWDKPVAHGGGSVAHGTGLWLLGWVCGSCWAGTPCSILPMLCSAAPKRAFPVACELPAPVFIL